MDVQRSRSENCTRRIIHRAHQCLKDRLLVTDSNLVKRPFGGLIKKGSSTVALVEGHDDRAILRRTEYGNIQISAELRLLAKSFAGQN